MKAALTHIDSFLSSRSLALTLLSAFLSLCVLGTVVPQEGVETSRTVRAWIDAHPVLARSGMTNIFTTGYFLAVVAAGWVNILFSTIRVIRKTRAVNNNLPLTAGQVARQRTVITIPATVTGEMLEQALPGARFRMAPQRSTFRGERYGFSRWSITAFHLSLLVLIAGVLLDRATFSREVYSIVERDHFVTGKDRPVSREKGFLVQKGPDQVRVTLVRVNDSHEQPGYQPGLASELRIGEGAGSQEVLLTRSGPIELNSMSIYQSPRYGYAPVFTRLLPDGVERSGTIRMAQQGTSDDRPGKPFLGEGLVPGTRLRIACRFQPDGAYTGIPGAIEVSFLQDGRVLYEGVLAPGEIVTMGYDRLRLDEIIYWTDLVVGRQPWPFLLYAGAAGAFLSLLVFVLFNPCFIAVAIDRERGTTTIAVQCPRFRSAEGRILAQLVQRTTVEGATCREWPNKPVKEVAGT